ncbi:MAG: DUF421 domain-containing protein [Clostridium sp.]|nr:DUF421 domain-containing protein [Clostridium sp.]
MEIIVLLAKAGVMMLVTWTCLRFLGKKSIADMTSYDLAATMILSNITAEPLVYKIVTKATIGGLAVTIVAVLIGIISLSKFFYNIDATPLVLVVNGKILKDELKKSRINIPLLMSELRLKGYQDLADIEFVIVEPSGKISVIPKSQSRPIQPSDLAITTSPINLSYSLIIDGRIMEDNLLFLKQDKSWLYQQLKAFGVSSVEEVLLAQIDSKGNLYVNKRNKNIKTPSLY